MSKDSLDLLKARPIQIMEWAQANCLLNEASRNICDVKWGYISSQFHLKSSWFLYVSSPHKYFHWFPHISPHSLALTLFKTLFTLYMWGLHLSSLMKNLPFLFVSQSLIQSLCWLNQNQTWDLKTWPWLQRQLLQSLAPVQSCPQIN